MNKRQKIDLPTAEILTWSPNNGQLFLAMFKGLPISFSGPSIEAVTQKAHDWRIAELDRYQEIAANKVKAAERLRVAREQKEALA